MSASKSDAAVYPGRATDLHEPSHGLRRWWGAITALIVAATFLEAILAGAMLSGVGWARGAHAANALVLIVSTTIAGLASLVTLRRIPHGAKLGWILLSLAAVLFLQAAVGALSAKGANLLWAHIPLGVALVGFAMQAAARARRLGEE